MGQDYTSVGRTLSKAEGPAGSDDREINFCLCTPVVLLQLVLLGSTTAQVRVVKTVG